MDQLFYNGPVTALHVLEPYVFAGVGSYLKVYDINRRCCIKSTNVLPCRNIHGIRKREGLMDKKIFCIFGEKCVQVVSFDVSCQTLLKTSQHLELEDWILDVSWLNDKEGGDNHIVAATSHNVILKINWKDNTIQQRVQCVENCILYCARFIGHAWNNLILAAGTVFNQVLIWSPHGKSVNGKVSVMHTFSGHQGVIFSIHFNLDRQLLCSVSDDRSIRIWQLKFTDNIGSSSSSDFKEITRASWETCTSSALDVLYGHSARVWTALILNNRLISVGEDSTCCVWNTEGQVIQKFKGHKGKSIWSLAVDDDERIAVTGGGDSSIRVWMLDSPTDKAGLQHDVTLFNLPLQQADTSDFPRSVTLLNYNTLLVVTNEGHLFSYNILTKNWSTVMTDEEFSSYLQLEVCRYCVPTIQHVVAIGNLHGKLKLLFSYIQDQNVACTLTTWKEYSAQVYNGKIFSINWLSNELMLTTGPDGVMIIWKLVNLDPNLELEEVVRCILPMCKQRWVSAAAITDDGQKLVCGDRGGSIHLYCIMEEDKQESCPVQTFPKIHGKAGVTDVCCHGDYVYTAGRDGQYRQYYLENSQLVLLNSSKVYKGFEWIDKLSFTDEDQDIHIYGFHGSDFILWSVNNNQKLLQIPCGGGHRAWDSCIHDNNVRFVYIKTKDIVMCESKLQNNLVVLKESLHGREVTDVKHICSYADGMSIIATCSEDTGVQISLLYNNEHNVIEMATLQRLQGHISSVRTLTVCESGQQQLNTNRKLLFSAGGRAQLIVWRISISSTDDLLQKPTNKEDISCLHENLCSFMLGHVKMKKHSRPWRLRHIYTNPETRFMDLVAINDKDVFLFGTGFYHFLTAACSDGFVRFYCFKELTKELVMITESEFHNHCVLKVHNLIVKSHDNNHVIILSAGTDGRVAFWDMTLLFSKFLIKTGNVSTNTEKSTAEEEDTHSLSNSNSSMINENVSSLTSKEMASTVKEKHDDHLDNIHKQEMVGVKPVFVMSLHQSGVNSLDVYKLEDMKYMYLICSGGDDNCLKISIVKAHFSQNNKLINFTLEKSGQVVSAHAAQITGVKFLNRDFCLSVSIDQRACVWKITDNTDCLQIEMIDCKFINVADLANIDAWKTNDGNNVNVILGGVGIGLLSIPDVNLNQKL